MEIIKQLQDIKVRTSQIVNMSPTKQVETVKCISNMHIQTHQQAKHIDMVTNVYFQHVEIHQHPSQVDTINNVDFYHAGTHPTR